MARMGETEGSRTEEPAARPRGKPPAGERELLRGNTESLLLYLIAEFGQIHGYQLIQEVRNRSRGYFQFRAGTVYPALHKLEQEGLIKGEWQSRPGSQQRRHYMITAKGKEGLSQRIITWRRFTAAMDLILKPEQP
jgi:DNA-binding PadR family transcriptional regulator